MTDKDVNAFGEPLVLPPTFVHPNTGKYKDESEAFFEGKAVRIYIDVTMLGQPARVPVWLDFVRFEDHVLEDGGLMRMGLGRTQKAIESDAMFTAGMELSFHPAEVFDVIQAHTEDHGVPLSLVSA